MAIIYSNIVEIPPTDFEQYLKAEGYSHSYIKNSKYGLQKDFNVTEKVRVGKLVDAFLTNEQADMNDSLYLPCKEIAAVIKRSFGELLKVAKTQVSYTAIMELSRLKMPTKGRLDLLIPGVAVIDMKVTFAPNIDSLIEFMGYKNQLWHYARLAKVSKAYIIACRLREKDMSIAEIAVKKIDVRGDNEFWNNAIMEYGKV
jgi:hypothetical protein